MDITVPRCDVGANPTSPACAHDHGVSSTPIPTRSHVRQLKPGTQLKYGPQRGHGCDVWSGASNVAHAPSQDDTWLPYSFQSGSTGVRREQKQLRTPLQRKDEHVQEQHMESSALRQSGLSPRRVESRRRTCGRQSWRQAEDEERAGLLVAWLDGRYCLFPPSRSFKGKENWIIQRRGREASDSW